MVRLSKTLFVAVGILLASFLLAELGSRLIFHKELELSTMARYNLNDTVKAYFRNTRDSAAVLEEDKTDQYVIFIGDSFTYGDGVKRSEAFPAIYESCKRRNGSALKVLNLGIKGSSLIDHSVFISNLLEKYNHENILAVVHSITQNDRYIDHWGIHPYEVCPQSFKYSSLRSLHYNFFITYLADYYLHRRSHHNEKSLIKDLATEQCLSQSFSKMNKLLKEKNIPLFRTYLFDIYNSSASIASLKEGVTTYANNFQKDFPDNYININNAFQSISTYSELYGSDNYHFNPMANALIGEYLCNEIDL